MSTHREQGSGSPPASLADKAALLTALYLAQGLPYGFFTLALPVLLRDAGLSLTAISALGLLALPWAFKFLWAPLLDQRGTRRGWLLALQGASIAGALLLSQLDLDSSYALLFAAAVAFNLIAASQDVVTDGLAVRLLDARERGLGNGLQVGAYRLGMILGGGLLLWIFARTNWTVMFLCMAALLALTVLPVLRTARTVSGPDQRARARLRTGDGLGPAGPAASDADTRRADILLSLRRPDGDLAARARSSPTPDWSWRRLP